MFRLPNKWYEPLGMRLIAWILLGEKAEHGAFFFIDTAQTKDDAYYKQHDGHDASGQCAAEEREHRAGIDRVADICIGAAGHQLMIFLRI